jgi:hypothetical protein
MGDGLWLGRNDSAAVLRRPVTWLFLLYTRLAYRRLAGHVVRDIGDYIRSGQTVQAVVGVGGSPSCGVRTTLNLKGVLGTIAGCDPHPAEDGRLQPSHHRRSRATGQGVFIAALRLQLRRRGLDLPFDEHDLIAEITR